MSLNQHYRKEIFYAMIGPAALSCFGCIFVLCMFCLFPGLRNGAFKMIFTLSVFDFVNSAAFLIPTFDSSNNSVSCQAQAIILNFSSMGSSIWCSMIAIFLYLAIVKSRVLSERFLTISLILTLLTCSIITLVPLYSSDSDYGKTKGWCWIPDQYKWLRYSIFFIPLWLIIILNCFIYCRIISAISHPALLNDDSKIKRKLKSKLFLYPLILIVCYTPYSLKAILEYNIDLHDEFTFTCVSGAMRALHGFLNFVAYGLNSSVQKYLRGCIRRNSEEQSLVTLFK